MPTLLELHTLGRFSCLVIVTRNGVKVHIGEIYVLDGKSYVNEFDTGKIKRICDYN